MASAMRWLLLLTMVVAVAGAASRGHGFGGWTPFLPFAFVVIYMARAWWSARQSAPPVSAPSQPAMTTAARYPPDETRELVSTTVKVFVVVGGAFALLLVGSHLVEKWHPAVDVHRAELLDAAAKAASCSPNQLTI